MAKRTAQISSVNLGDKSWQFLVTAFEEKEIEGQIQPVPLGEMAFEVQAGTPDAEIIAQVESARSRIEERADAARHMRERLNYTLASES